MNKVYLEDLGNIRYKSAWDYQTELLEAMKSRKLANRKLDEADRESQSHHFLFCEHPHVYTLGKSGSEDHLLIDQEKRDQEEVEYFKINRGGDITYHGPGQIVGYPILDLDEFFTDVHKYVRFIEETIIRTCADYNIEASRIKDFTGVWLLDGQVKRKICAIGVHLSRWITMHGFAFNVNTDLSYFNHIVPCGIQAADKTVSSLSAELKTTLDIEDVKARIKYHFQDLFQVEFVEK